MRAVPFLFAMQTLALVACSAASPHSRGIDTAKIVDAIKTDEVHWNADWKSGNPAKVAAHYAPDAVLMVPGLAPMVGSAAILKGIDETFEQPGFTMTFASDRVDVARSGDLAAARGSYKTTMNDAKTGAPTIESGTYVTVYKPQPGGAWKAVWDINTPGIPAPPPPAR
ncbi:MAG: DUF4440 domain-containing protein [Caulobacteraceae bacterium]